MEILLPLHNCTADSISTTTNSTHVFRSDYVDYADPEILTLLAMGSIGFILNIAVISIASRRPAFLQVPVKSLIISLGTANLYIIAFCMMMNAAWTTIGVWFSGDCRFFKTIEAFCLNAAAYIVVAWSVDRSRSCIVRPSEKNVLGASVKKPRHLTKLVIASWVLAVLLSLQHVSAVRSLGGVFGLVCKDCTKSRATCAMCKTDTEGRGVGRRL